MHEPRVTIDNPGNAQRNPIHLAVEYLIHRLNCIDEIIQAFQWRGDPTFSGEDPALVDEGVLDERSPHIDCQHLSHTAPLVRSGQTSIIRLLCPECARKTQHYDGCRPTFGIASSVKEWRG